jgi:DNA invertase Pin-like site-specific DNA recombinase
MSTDIQIKGDSLRRQSQLSIDYAEKHGLILDDQFKLKDIGVSAFTGQNLNSGELGLFLKAVKAGQIPKGSYLLVESLDRISRQTPTTAAVSFLDLINNGINLVTLSDGQLFKAGATDWTQLLVSIVGMARAYEESRLKSERVGKAWSNKRDHGASKKLTKICPAWLKLSGDRGSFEVVKDRDGVVKRIFDESLSGLGTYSITQRLNRDRIPPFGKSGGWVQSYVAKIIKNRAVIGEYQPHKMIGGKRVPEGDVIKDYFPWIIEPNLFYQVQAAQRRRLASPSAGRKGEHLSNLFTHIAECRYCGSPMHFVNKGKASKGGTYLKCSRAITGRECVTTGWRYADFEKSFLYFVSEIDLGSIFQASAINIERKAAEARLTELDERIREAQSRQNKIFETISVSTVSAAFLGKKLDEVQAEIEALEAEHSLLKTAQAPKPEIASQDELREQIMHLQEGKHANYLDRVAIASKLKSAIKTLSIATRGREPLLAKVEALLEKNDVDADYREQIIDNLTATGIENRFMSKTFYVQFADDSTRGVAVDADDPTQFVTYVDKMPSGLTLLRRDDLGRMSDHSEWFSQRPEDDAEDPWWEKIDWDGEVASVPHK